MVKIDNNEEMSLKQVDFINLADYISDLPVTEYRPITEKTYFIATLSKFGAEYKGLTLLLSLDQEPQIVRREASDMIVEAEEGMLHSRLEKEELINFHLSKKYRIAVNTSRGVFVPFDSDYRQETDWYNILLIARVLNSVRRGSTTLYFSDEHYVILPRGINAIYDSLKKNLDRATLYYLLYDIILMADFQDGSQVLPVIIETYLRLGIRSFEFPFDADVSELLSIFRKEPGNPIWLIKHRKENDEFLDS